MNFSTARLQRILAGPTAEFRLGDYISQGFQFMNANFGMLLAYMLLTAMISFVCQIIPVIGMVIGVLITPVLQIGYSQFIYAVTRGHKADLGEFFKGFNRMGPLISTYLLTLLIGLVSILPGLFILYQAGIWEWLSIIIEQYPYIQEVPNLFETVDAPLFWLGFLVMMAGILVITILFAWSLNIIWFYEVGPLEALNASRKLIARNWLSFVAFIIVAGLIGAAGVLLCGIGLLYTIPAMYCAQFFAFADSVRLFEDDGEDRPDLIDHFIA